MPTKSISECKHDVHAEAEAKAHINQVPATPSPHNVCTGRSYDNRATFDSHWLEAGVRTCTEEQKGSEASARHRQQTENTTSVTQPPTASIWWGSEAMEGSVLSSKPPPLSSQAFHLSTMWYCMCCLVECAMTSIWFTIETICNLLC